MPYNPDSTTQTDTGRVRLLINDVDNDHVVFTDGEIGVFLELSSGHVLLAAAQALDTIADDEALTSKAIRTQDVQTDGPKVADSLRKRAQSLRDQHAATTEADDEGFFDVIGTLPEAGPELGPHVHLGWL